MAPYALQAAAFKKNRCPNPRTILGGHPLNFGNEAVRAI
jgi:hypothetical protein